MISRRTLPRRVCSARLRPGVVRYSGGRHSVWNVVETLHYQHFYCCREWVGDRHVHTRQFGPAGIRRLSDRPDYLPDPERRRGATSENYP